MNGKIDMKPKVYIKSALCLLLAAACFAISCSKTPEEKFTQALAAATEGDVAARADLEGLLINAAAEATFAENGIRCDGSVMWVAYDDEVRLLYPRDSRFPMLAPDMNLMRGADNANVVFSNGIELFVFAWSGDIVRRLTAGTEKEPVRGVTVLNGSVYYFSNSKIYSLPLNDSAENNEPKQFVKQTFVPPYTKLYNTYMYARGSKIGLLLGVAGSYYLNVIDTAAEKTLNTKIRMAAPKLYLDDDSVLHIFGNTGGWRLSRFWYASGKRDNYQSYKEINDVEILPNELMINTGDGYCLGKALAKAKDIKLPAAYLFKGVCNGMALVEYNGVVYGLNAGKFYDMLTQAIDLLPERQ